MTKRIAQRYVLEESLGHGGMGQVFRALDTVESRRVALKLLKADTSAAEQGFHQFKQEFRVALSLRHPHLVQVHDFGEDHGAPFFTMELVEGPPVATGHTHDAAETCDMLAQLLLALELLHSRGVLHRDVKPANLRFAVSGELKLLDLGLLEAIGTPSAGQISGTITYLPPEALSGRPLTPAADLYSVGVVAYELLSGRHPFADVPAREMLSAIVQMPPPPLEEVAPEVPAALALLVGRLLAKNPADRPQRASDVIRALGPWLTPSRIAEGQQQAYSYLQAPGLVGRGREFTWLLAVVGRLHQGLGGAAFVGAEAGVGKSRLIQEVRLHCQLEGTPFLTARCTHEGGSPYGMLRQILAGLIPLAAEAVLAAFGPLVRAVVASEGGLAPLAGGQRDEFHAQVAAFIAAVAKARPVVLFVDDLQWADSLS
ncbi:MAG: serine/threonine-protein kinase, partial [Candidatus Sericytochromatia bacterium]